MQISLKKKIFIERNQVAVCRSTCNSTTLALTWIPLPIDIKIRKVTYMQKEGCIPINIHEG